MKLAVLVVALVGCSDDPRGGSLTFSGAATDVTTGAPIEVEATAMVEGLAPAPAASASGSTVSFGGVPNGSIVDVVVSAAGYATTRTTIAFGDSSPATAAPFVVSEAKLAEFAATAGVTMTPDHGVALLRLSSAVPEDLAFYGDAQGPVPLDDGLVAYFEVAPGIPIVTSAPDKMLATDTQLVITAGAVTIGDVAGGMPAKVPAPIHFAEHVAPILEGRCGACHDGFGSHGTVIAHVDTMAPTSSALLAAPSRGGMHRNVVFASPAELDYRTILAWIALGARND